MLYCARISVRSLNVINRANQKESRFWWSNPGTQIYHTEMETWQIIKMFSYWKYNAPKLINKSYKTLLMHDKKVFYLSFMFSYWFKYIHIKHFWDSFPNVIFFIKLTYFDNFHSKNRKFLYEKMSHEILLRMI